MRKYTLNESFFKEWSHEMAYILGFITADGCIYSGSEGDKYVLTIGLNSKDKYILESIANIMGYNGPVYDNINQNTSCLSINSKEIFNDLNALGLSPRKSLTLEWPKNIPDEFMCSYVLGFFDGDGSVFHIKHPHQARPYIGVNFVGTQSFLLGVRKVLNQQIGRDASNVRGYKIKSGTYYGLCYSGDETIKIIYDYLYSNSREDLRLTRKYNIFNDFYHEGKIIHASKKQYNYVPKTQAQHEVSAFGITQSLTQWAHEDCCQCNRQQLYYRIYKLGLDPEYSIVTSRLPMAAGQNIENKKVQGNSKINWEIAEQIRTMREINPALTSVALSEIFNTTKYIIDDVLCNRTWINPDYSPTKKNNGKIYITHNNKTQTIREWSKELNIPYTTIDRRYRENLPIDQVLHSTESRLKLGKSQSDRDIKAYDIAEKVRMDYKSGIIGKANYEKYGIPKSRYIDLIGNRTCKNDIIWWK